ncbi:MAG: 3-carboxymuconate cyclase-like protein [Bacteroidetes bacterium]|nr:3-carboxymuconate cyclase-like protein [Bacteroidota bacterium]
MLRKLTSSIFICLATLTFSQNSYKMLVGTYTHGTTSEGIYALEFSGKGKLVSQKLLVKSDNPSFLAFSPDRKYVYAVNETGSESTISAYAFNKTNETLTFINKVNAGGADPCFVLATDKHVFTANYSSGSISVFARNANGSLSDTVQIVKQGRKNFGNNHFSPSNAHQVNISPNGKYVMGTNLGTDRIFTYTYNPTSKNNILKYKDEILVKKNSGPRHTVFSKNGKFLYLVQELDASVTVLSVADDGKLTIIQETTLVTDKTKSNGAADIHLCPDGKFLYATNRGEANNITCFRVGKDGKITFNAQYPANGNGPRNFAISADGKFVFVGNQKTNNITVFSRNLLSGKLKMLDEKIEMGAPVCLLLY